MLQLTVLLFCINLVTSLSGGGQRNGTTTPRTDAKEIPKPGNKYGGEAVFYDRTDEVRYTIDKLADKMDGGLSRPVSENVEDSQTSTIITNKVKQTQEVKNGYIVIRLWPDKTLLYDMDSSIENSGDRTFRSNILSAMQMISSETCAKFRRKTRSDKYWATFSIIKSNPLIPPAIGWQNIENQMMNVTFADGKYGYDAIGIIAHQVLHALGFLDEHNRNDRDQYVAIQFDNVKLDRRYDLLKDQYTGKSKTKHYSVPYNYDSIMHATSNRLAFDKSKDSVTPIKNPNAIGAVQNMGQRKKLSTGDVITINNKYQCGQRQIMPPSPNTLDR